MKIKSAVAIALAVLVAFVAFRPAFLARAGDERPSSRNASVRGFVVDLYSYMTGVESDEAAVKISRKLIRGGVPVALVTNEGLVILGQGKRSPARLVEVFAHQNIWAKGRLYEKNGVRYLDLRSARAAREGADYDGEFFLDEDEFDDPDAPPDE